jgi:hypothetical protein
MIKEISSQGVAPSPPPSPPMAPTKFAVPMIPSTPDQTGALAPAEFSKFSLEASVPEVSGYDVGGLHLGGQYAGQRGPMPPQKYMVWKGSETEAPEGCSWHPLAGKDGNPTPGFTPTAYPPRPICFVPFPGNPNDNNHTPGEYPLSWVNITEFMCNKLSQCLGPEFSRFDVSTSSRSPAFDLSFATRVLSVSGMEHTPGVKSWYGVDTNPSTGTLVAEFDCPADAWFFTGSNADDSMPYSILMEIALQTCGILTSVNKAPLTMDRDNILFRNLDASAKLIKNVDSGTRRSRTRPRPPATR